MSKVKLPKKSRRGRKIQYHDEYHKRAREIARINRYKRKMKEEQENVRTEEENKE